MAELSPYTLIDRISLLVTLYKKYIELRKSDETFDNFVFWGDMLLGDFDDVDKYMVDTRQLFTNIHDLKEIDEFYLTEEQIEIVKRFWGHLFFPSTESDNKQQFIQLWQILFDLYTGLRDELSSRNKAYEGMIFRDVAEQSKRKEALDLPYTQVVFIGVNAITEAEKIFMEYLRDIGIGDFYWDYYAPTLQDSYNKAAFFLNDNKRRFPSKIEINEHIEQTPQIELISIPSAVGQAKQATDILQSLIDNNHLSPEKAINTAIVLPDEELLLPMLYSIPPEISTVNITMGYTLPHHCRSTYGINIPNAAPRPVLKRRAEILSSRCKAIIGTPVHSVPNRRKSLSNNEFHQRKQSHIRFPKRIRESSTDKTSVSYPPYDR